MRANGERKGIYIRVVAVVPFEGGRVGKLGLVVSGRREVDGVQGGLQPA